MMRDRLRTLLHRSVAAPGRQRRSGRPGLLTPRVPLGAAVLVRDATGRILLLRQTYQRPAIWLPPGGWVDRGETPQQAACREVREEVGLEVTVGHPLAVRGGGYGEVTILFACAPLCMPILRLSDEIEEARFFAADALPPLTDSVRLWLAEALATLAAAPAPSAC